MNSIIIGQECICPDGLGRVVDISKSRAGIVNIKVDTYVNNRSCMWSAFNVRMIPIPDTIPASNYPLGE